jgi:quinol monooxygenase YgiN
VSFLQIIEFTSSRVDELDALLDEWLERTQGKRTAIRGVQARDRDRDRPNTYVQIVEFPSYEAAMANSELPETAEVAARLAELCDGPPTFRNLDVARDMQM